MKNLADFKRRLKLGCKIETTHARMGSLGIREVSIVQSNSFALKTQRDGKAIDSWCEYPKAKDIEFLDENTAVIYWGEGERREQILTYKFI
jgi:hypothetical protein